MNKYTKLIKGLLLGTLFMGLMSLNLQPVLDNHVANSKTEIETSQEARVSSFVPHVFAAEPPPPPPPPPTGDEGGVTTPPSPPPAPGAAAEEAPAAGTPDAPTIDPKLVLESAAKASTYVNHIFNPLIYFLTSNIGNFLKNDYIFAGSMGEMLNDMWIVSRNIVNIIFVLILLFIAIQHIFSGEEKSDLKKLLPTFVIMLIAVNFSWLATRVVLDASNVATQIVFQIPSGIKGVAGEPLPGECKVEGTEKVTGPCAPTDIIYPSGATKLINATEDLCDAEKEVQKTLGDSVVICWQKMDLSNYSMNNAAYYLSFSMARVQNLTRAIGEDAKGAEFGKVAIGAIFSMLIQVVYLIAFAVLYVVLIVRIAALWLFVGFSPLLVLLLFFQRSGLGGIGESVGGFGIKGFVKWAFVPVKVGAVWAIGFIMVTAGQTMSPEFFNQLGAQGNDITASSFNLGSLFLGMETMQEFIWLILTTGIIWMGTFAALSDLEIVSQFTDWVKNQGTRFARFVGSAPKWAPVIPQYNAATGEWTRVSLDKLGKGYKEKMLQYLGVSGEISVVQKFDNGAQYLQHRATAEDLRLIKDGNYTQTMGKLSTITGLSHKELHDKTNESHLRKMLSTKFKDAKVVDDIIVRVHSRLPGTAPTPEDKAAKAAKEPPPPEEPPPSEPTIPQTGVRPGPAAPDAVPRPRAGTGTAPAGPPSGT